MATIVVCEDDPVIVKLVRAALRPLGHELHIAEDGVQGLRLVEQLRPDLLLTDVHMPNMGGLELVDALRASDTLRHIAVVLVTASVQRQDLEEGQRRGVVGFVAKPFGAATLRAQVEAILSPPAPA